MPPPEVLGPLGLTIAAVIAVVVLWRDHQVTDKELRVDRNYWRTLALQGLEQAEKGTRLADRALQRGNGDGH